MPRVFEDGHAPDFSTHLVKDLKDRCPHIFMVCFRDKNQNVMVYQACVDAHGKLLDPPVEAYWLNLEPSYRQARKAKGIHHDREDLSFLDRTLAWGFETKRRNDHTADFKFKQFDLTMTVKANTKGAKLLAVMDEKKYFLRSLTVKASENLHLLNIRDNLKSLCVYGLDITKKPFVKIQHYLKGKPE